MPTIRDELYSHTKPGQPFTVPGILNDHYAELSTIDRMKKKNRFCNILSIMRKQNRAWIVEEIQVNAHCKVNVWVRE